MAKQMILSFDVENQTLKRKDENKIVEKSKNYLVATFNFSSDWEGTRKAVIIEKDNLKFKKYLDENNSCVIPNRTISYDGFSISVVGEDSNEYITITTSVLFIAVNKNNIPEEVNPYIREITSETLDIEKENETCNIEIPSEYVTDEKLSQELENYVDNESLEETLDDYAKETDLSIYATKQELNNTFAPKTTAITHTGNQLQDYSGNNIYSNTYFSKILAELNTWITATNAVDLNDYVNNNVILFGGFHSSSTHLPSGIDKAKNYIMEVRRNNFSSASVYNVTQTLYSVNNSKINMYVRSYATTSNAWSDWATIEFDVYFDTIKSKNNTWIVSNSVVDLNDYTTNNILMFGGFNNSSQNLPSDIDKSQQYLFKSFRNNYTSSSTYTVSQELIMLTGTYTIIYTRNYASVNNTWSSWIKTDKEIYYDTIVPKDYTWIVSSQTVNLNDYNNFNMIVFGGFNNNSTNLPNGIDKSKNYLLKVSRGIYHPNQKYLIVQELIGIDTPITYTRHFENINNAWTSWISPAKTRTQISITSSSDFITQMNNAFSLGDCDVYISIGEFDMTSLIETYYNNNQYGARGRFIQLGNNCKYYFSSNTHLIAEYDGDNSTLMLNFSMFNCDGTDFELNGLYASCKNLRYVIHDDPSSKHDDVGYTHIYTNCILELDNTTNPNLNYMDTIGGGIGANDTIIINGGRYKSIPNPSNTYPTRDLAYHSYGTSYYDYEFTDNFYITNVYFENTFAIGKISTSDYGTLYCQASNNSMSHTAYAGTGTSHGAGYATLVLWNNVIRS